MFHVRCPPLHSNLVTHDVLFSTIKVVSRHQTTQQYGTILPIELTTDDIRNSKAYKEYYVCAIGEAAPKPKASARKKKGGSTSSTTPPTSIATPTPITTVVAAPRLSAAAKGVPDVPSDDSEEEHSWNSSDDEDVDEQTKGREESEGDKTDEKISKIGEQEVTESDEGDDEATESDRESEDEETREQEEESFDPIPRTPEDNEDDDNNEEDQGLRIGEEERMQEEEEADELYRDVDINQGRGLQVSQETEDSHRSDEQRNLYKVLVEAYDVDKTILDTYGESTILKRRREDDDQEEPSAGSDRGSKRLREGGEHPSASTPSEPATGSASRSTTGSQSQQLSASESAFAEEPVQTTCQMEEPSHLVFETGAEDQPIIQTTQHPEWFSQPRRPPTPDRNWNKSVPAAQGNAQSWISALAKQTDARSSFNELLDTPIDFSNFIINRLGVDTLTPDLLAGPTYKLIRGSCNSLTELEYHLEEVYKVTTDQLDWANPKGQQYPHNLLQPLPLIPDSRDYGHIKWIEDLVPGAMWIQEPISYDKHSLWGVSYWGRKRQQFYGFAVNRESALDVYSKRRIIAVTKLKIVEWHNYKHLDWISVRRNDDKIYTFKEGDLKRLRIQDIEDMLLLLIQGKLSNLTIEERFAFNVSLRMFTRSIVIQRRVEDLQLGVESYQKRLNLTNPDTYQSDMKRREAYTAYSNPKGCIYQNKDKKNRLMWIDELYKFSDGMLNDVRNAIDNRLKGIRMQYLPTTIWRRGDKDRATTMIQAIDKMLKTRRIMRSLERFVGGRQYEGDFRMLQRTI
nr:hypothetical protein [Tanacetum cinerariifolium]